MSQNDPIMIEEYRNPLIEFSRSIIFLQNNSGHNNNNNTCKLDHLTANNRKKKYRYGSPAKLGHLNAKRKFFT